MAARFWHSLRRTTSLKTIPTVILTTSEAEADIVNSYRLQANCYLNKPVRFDAFESLVKSINDFWLTKVKLPAQVPSDERKCVKSVLLVEDNPGDARLLRKMLNEQEFQIDTELGARGDPESSGDASCGAYGRHYPARSGGCPIRRDWKGLSDTRRRARHPLGRADGL